MFCRDELDWSEREAGKGSWGQRFRPSLDRVNNEETLTKDNVRVICQRCNSMKSKMSDREFIEICGQIWKNYGDPTKNGIKRFEMEMEYRKHSREHPIKVMGIIG